jgi:hypothetical protein
VAQKEQLVIKKIIKDNIMKYFLILYISILFVNNVSANKIDSLQTDIDVKNFILLIDSDLSHSLFQLKPTNEILENIYCSDIAKKWDVKNWEKVDVTNDGLTDLVTTIYLRDGFYNYIFIDEGNNNFKKIVPGTSLPGNCEFIKPIVVQNQSLLQWHHFKQIYNAQSSSPFKIDSNILVDTLIYKFGNLIEFNTNPAQYNISSIQFKVVPCNDFQDCSPFSFVIDKNGLLKYRSREENFTAKINTEKFLQLTELLNYLNIKRLDTNYQLFSTHMESCCLKLKFSDGSTKVINDYGMAGTLGLKMLYQYFFNLRKNKTNIKK